MSYTKWTWGENTDGGWGVWEDGGRGRPIATLATGTIAGAYEKDFIDRNAKLIAAAPAMKGEMTRLTDGMEEVHDRLRKWIKQNPQADRSLWSIAERIGGLLDSHDEVER